MLSVSRLVVEPHGFLLLLVGLVGLHVVTYIIGLWLINYRQPSSPSKHHPTKTIATLVILIVMNIGITVSSHIYKAQWFGFAFYHIPSPSMAPTLLVGDVVMVDTWLYKNEQPEVGDVVVIKRSKNSLVMAKRVAHINIVDKSETKLFLQGDNINQSIDSRRFGWVSNEYLIGKINFVWFSFKKVDRFFGTVE